ncbi:MAG: hypothetical protein ACO3QQ_06835, partial [Candidatus Nanopelagicaceae bacterium]
MERERSVKVNELSGISDQGSKEALSLRKEIATLDKGIAENQMATANAAYEKAVQQVDLKKGALDLVGREVELQKEAGDITRSRYETELSYVQTLMDYAQARHNLIQSEYDIQSAQQNQRIQAAEAELEAMRASKDSKSSMAFFTGRSKEEDITRQEQVVKRLKEEQRQIAIKAKKAELEGLADIEKMEWATLELKQKGALIDQRARIAEAAFNVDKQRQLLLELRVKLKDPNLSPEQKQQIKEQIKLQEGAVSLAGERLNLERDRYRVLVDQNKVERDTLSLNQQARRNKTYAELVNLGGRYAGGPVDPRFKYTVNELGMESFLSATGTISWIHKPAYGTWSPPTRGVVLPAGITQQLAEVGALPPQPGMPRKGRGSLTRIEQLSQAVSMNPSQNQIILAMQRQSLELGKLQRSI